MFAAVGSQKAIGNWNFPSTKNSLHVFGALRTFRAGWLWCSCCCAEQERCHATTRPIAILLTNILSVALGPFLWLPMQKAFMCRRIARTLLAKNCLHSHAAKVAWNSFLPPPKRMNDDALQGENPTKWLWEKGCWRWVLDEIDALQTGSKQALFFLNTFYKTMNALVWFHKIVIMAVDQNHPMQLTGNTIS